MMPIAHDSRIIRLFARVCKMWNRLIALTSAVGLCGCAEMMQTFQKDPVRSTNLGFMDKDDRSVLSVASFDASRRNLMVVLDGPNKGRFCAEPPADVALNVESKTKGGAKVDAGKSEARVNVDAQAESDYRDTVTILAQRTVLLDIYRTGAYTLCQYYLNGALSPEEASRQFFTLTDRVLESYAKQLTLVALPSAAASGPTK